MHYATGIQMQLSQRTLGKYALRTLRLWIRSICAPCYHKTVVFLRGFCCIHTAVSAIKKKPYQAGKFEAIEFQGIALQEFKYNLSLRTEALDP